MAYCLCVERLQINYVTAVTVQPDREFQQWAELHYSLKKEMQGSCKCIVLGRHNMAKFESSCIT
jgi:hypothetical protein